MQHRKRVRNFYIILRKFHLKSLSDESSNSAISRLLGNYQKGSQFEYPKKGSLQGLELFEREK